VAEAPSTHVLREEHPLEAELAHQAAEGGLDQAMLLPVLIVLAAVGNDLALGPGAHDVAQVLVHRRQVLERPGEIVYGPHPVPPVSPDAGETPAL
jgi:hypothetical protein